MKISLGMNLQPGPWGGGNQFGQSLARYLRQHDVDLSFDLRDPDLDLILLAEPRSELKISAYTDLEIMHYLRRVRSEAIVVHRINECDERKGTAGVNSRLLRANLCADHTVFVSSWLRDLFQCKGLRTTASVILNGSDESLFNSQGHNRWDSKSPAKIVTHHWGGGWLKGFDVYERLDQLLESPRFKGRIEFTYIGNLPKGFSFKNANYVPPVHGVELANVLRAHDIYLTASQNEPGGHHQNEGGNCGLPILYRMSASMPEYCEGFGLGFNEGNFEEKLEQMLAEYEHWADRMPLYPHKAEKTSAAYFQLFKELVAQREKILGKRKWTRRVLWHLGSFKSK